MMHLSKLRVKWKEKDAFLLENYSKNQRGGNLNHFCSPKLWFLVLNIISYLCPFLPIGSNQTGLRSGKWLLCVVSPSDNPSTQISVIQCYMTHDGSDPWVMTTKPVTNEYWRLRLTLFCSSHLQTRLQVPFTIICTVKRSFISIVVEVTSLRVKSGDPLVILTR